MSKKLVSWSVLVVCIIIVGIFFGNQYAKNLRDWISPTMNESGTWIQNGKIDPSIPAWWAKKETELPKPVITTTILNSEKMDKNPLLINNLSNRVYLMDKSGKELHVWDFGEEKLWNDFSLLPDGTALASIRSTNAQIRVGWFWGITARVSSWAEFLWEYEISGSWAIAHHDAEMLPNGNILAMVWGKIGKDEVKKYGSTSPVDIYTERIVEIDPKTNKVVWRWNSLDHMIQDVDPKVPNYGTISKRPEKIDINYSHSQSGMIMHGNWLAYDAKNDLIYMSVYSFSEVWVIDHSTTPQEVNTGKGGRFGRWGDLVYRFGNPTAYGGTGTRLFYSSHHPSFTASGTFLIYSNGIKASPEQSTTYELSLPKELDEKKPTLTPPEVLWSYSNPEIYFDKVGGVVKAPNGNYIITEGDGKIWEVTRDKEVVWTHSEKPGMFWRTYVYPYGSSELIALGIKE